MIAASEFDSLIDCLEPIEYPNWSLSVEESLYVPEVQGFYSLYKTPFFRPVFEWMEREDVTEIAIMIPSQIGKSELLKAVAMEYAKRYSGKLVLYYCPTDSDSTTFVSKKLMPSVEESPDFFDLVKKGKHGNVERTALTKNSVKFTNGSEIRVLGTGSNSALVSKTSPLVILDEFSGMKDSARGDIYELAKNRTASVSYGNRKVIAASTPLGANQNIHKLYQESKQFTWVVPCPSCGVFQFLAFENLKWQDQGTESNVKFANRLLSGQIDVFYECPHCKHQLREKEKLVTLNKGKLECVGNHDLSDTKLALHVNGLYSVTPWNELASLYIKTLDDVMQKQVFTNQRLAAPWEESEKTRRLRKNSIEIADIPRGEAPADTYKIVAGMDVQGDHFYTVILAYTMSHKVHVIDWTKMPFDPYFPDNPNSYPFRLLERNWNGHELDMIMLDTGNGNHTQALYQLAGALSRCTPIKGYERAKYDGQYHFIGKKAGLILVPRHNTNELFEELVRYKRFTIPNNLLDEPTTDDDLLLHFTNVIRNGDKFEDIKKGARVDWRDATRYALSYMWMCEFKDLVDSELYRRENEAEIAKKRSATIQGFRSLFGMG